VPIWPAKSHRGSSVRGSWLRSSITILVWGWLVAGWCQPAYAASAPEITAADVALVIHRGGDTLSDGRSVQRRAAWVEGEVTYQLARPARAGEEIVLLDFAAFMRDEPVELDEVAFDTYVPRGKFHPARTELIGPGAGVSAVRREHDDQWIALGLVAGATQVTLRYTVDVPHRYWPLGCVRQRCSLSGAIAPLPSAPATGGRHLPNGRVVTPVKWTVTSATLARAAEVRPHGGRARRPAEVVVVGGDATHLTHYPGVLWGPRWYRTEKIHRGVTMTVLHTRPRPSGQVPHETFVQLRRDAPGHVLALGLEVIDVLAAARRAPRVGTTVTVVQGPLRSEVAQAHPDLIMLSDEALEILPAQRLFKFHEGAIARALLDDLVERAFRGRHDASTDLWLPGMVSFSLVGVWQQARELRDEFASDILRNFTFVPAVDRFLYTQQASFSQTYFRGVEDAPSLRNHPRWFSHELPTGRRLHEKLVDTLRPAALETFYRSITAFPKDDPVEAASLAYGHDLAWFFDQWLGVYPSVDYAVADVTSEATSTGYHHRITIARQGTVGVIEPVQVYVVDRDGKEHFLGWNGQLATDAEDLAEEPAVGRHVFELDTGAKLREVRLDPRSRLVQTPQPPHENVDPRFNDRTPPAFRFIYTGAGFSIAASEVINASTVPARLNAISGFASFEGSLRRDLRRTGHLLVSRDRETNVAVGAGANFWFGAKVNNQRRRGRVRLFGTGSWLNDRSIDPRGGVRLIESIAIIDDTRRFAWWPERGRRLTAGINARQIVRVDSGPSDTVTNLTASAGWVQLWRIAHDHVLATSVGAEAILPLTGTREFRSLTRAGGIGGLSGYVADEVFGQALAIMQAEYRHVYVGDLHLNAAHLGYLRAIAGTLFTGVASVAGCESYRGWFSSDSYYAHVGYALGAHLSIFGVTPQLFRVEVSVPMVRRTGVRCLDETLPDYLAEVQGLDDATRLLPPLNVNVTFQQTF
jgi:hypothetical protein